MYTVEVPVILLPVYMYITIVELYNRIFQKGCRLLLRISYIRIPFRLPVSITTTDWMKYFSLIAYSYLLQSSETRMSLACTTDGIY